MNKHWVMGVAVLLLLSACGRSTQLAVRAVADGGTDETALSQQVIRLLAYDRDSIFSHLASLATTPEPQPPEDLIQLRDSVAAAQMAWTDAEAAWNEGRSEMQALSTRMENMDRASNEYFEAYQEFDDLDATVRRLERAKQTYFETFTALQETYRTRADSFNVVTDTWADAAFEEFGAIVDSLIEARGEDLVDTTDTNGWAYFRVPRGNWWVHTRSKLVFEELYWNVPYNSAGGTDTLVLNASNAESRPIF